jgi:hypothetical protein
MVFANDGSCARESANELVFVDPYTFFALLKMYIKNEGTEAK